MRFHRPTHVLPPEPRAEIVVIPYGDCDAAGIRAQSTHVFMQFPGFSLLTLGDIDRSTVEPNAENVRLRVGDSADPQVAVEAIQAEIDRVAARRALACVNLDVMTVDTGECDGADVRTAITRVRGYVVLGALDWKDNGVGLRDLIMQDRMGRRQPVPYGTIALAPAHHAALAAYMIQRELESRAEYHASLPTPVLMVFGDTDERRAALVAAMGVCAPEVKVVDAGADVRSAAKLAVQKGTNPVPFDLDEYGAEDVNMLCDDAIERIARVQAGDEFGFMRAGAPQTLVMG